MQGAAKPANCARLAKWHPSSCSLTLFLATTSAASVSAPITHLVSVKVIEGLVSTSRIGTDVAAMWIEAVINVATEVVGAVELSVLSTCVTKQTKDMRYSEAEP